MGGVGARREHGGDDLVARDHGQLRAAHLAVADVQVGAAHAAGVDLDEHVAGREASSSGSGSSRACSGRPGSSRTMARIAT